MVCGLQVRTCFMLRKCAGGFCPTAFRNIPRTTWSFLEWKEGEVVQPEQTTGFPNGLFE